MPDPDRSPVLRPADFEEQERMQRRALLAAFYLSVLKENVPDQLAFDMVRDWHVAELEFVER